MKKRILSAFLTAAVFLIGCPTLEATVISFSPNEPVPVNIPDENSTGVTRTFTVTGVPAGALVNSVTLTLNADHTWVGDLRASLTSPDNETHVLFYDIGDPGSPAGGGDSSNLSGAYLFSDAGATTLWTAAEEGPSSFIIPPDTYRTTNINVNTATSMNATYGYPGLPFSEILTRSENAPQATNGVWTLTISDNAAGDTGTLNAGTTLNVDFSVPTAAHAGVRGQLITAGGRGVMNATVRIVNVSTGAAQETRSSSFGFFRFENLPVGATYAVEAISKKYQFPSRILELNDDVTDLTIEADGR